MSRRASRAAAQRQSSNYLKYILQQNEFEQRPAVWSAWHMSLTHQWSRRGEGVMRRWVLLIGCMFAMLLPSDVWSQSTSTDSVAVSVWQHAARNYWHVRLVVAEGDTLEGRVRYYRGEVNIANTDVPDSYLRLERRLSHGRGMYVGAGVGAIVGAAFIGGYAAALSEGNDDLHMAALAGAGGGAMLGMLIGHIAVPAKHRWIQIWP